jgi:hypothetical protein
LSEYTRYHIAHILNEEYDSECKEYKIYRGQIRKVSLYLYPFYFIIFVIVPANFFKLSNITMKNIHTWNTSPCDKFISYTLMNNTSLKQVYVIHFKENSNHKYNLKMNNKQVNAISSKNYTLENVHIPLFFKYKDFFHMAQTFQKTINTIKD